MLYYHKAGLLPEARRMENGYRVYGAPEMERMLEIRRLRDLGMDLSHIKEVLGGADGKPMQTVLMELRADLVSERQDIDERIARIDELLQDGPAVTASDLAGSSAFDEAMELLGREEAKKYEQDMPEMYEQQRRVMGLVESYEWGNGEAREAPRIRLRQSGSKAKSDGRFEREDRACPKHTGLLTRHALLCARASPMIAPAKTMGATRTNSHSNPWSAAAATAVSGSL